MYTKKTKRFFFTNQPTPNTNKTQDKTYTQINQPPSNENSNTNPKAQTNTQTLLTEEMKLTIDNAKKSEEKLNKTTQGIHQYIDKGKPPSSRN